MSGRKVKKTHCPMRGGVRRRHPKVTRCWLLEPGVPAASCICRLDVPHASWRPRAGGHFTTMDSHLATA
eukprot:13195052-Alexandrium_andersonii.AAC.1